MTYNNYLVYREEGLNDKQIIHRYEHNERKLDTYNNSNIRLDCIDNNIYFKKPDKTYWATFNEMIETGQINIKGLKKDANHYSEMIIAVNSLFWVDKSEEYIKNFFQCVHDYLVEQVGEENVLSSVLHVDEISDEGLVNYHLHFICIPVVEKVRYFTKRSQEYKKLAEEVGEDNILKNDKRLIKGYEKQVSHSKKFGSEIQEHTRKITYGYSIWQDKLVEELQSKGFDIARGEKNMKAVHIHPQAYKQILAKIKSDGEQLLPVEAKPFNDKYYLVDQQNYANLIQHKNNIGQQEAAYEMALEAMQIEQKKTYERQNKAFALWYNHKDCESECVRLRKENEELKIKLKGIFNQIAQENWWLKILVELIINVYQMLMDMVYTPNEIGEYINDTINQAQKEDAYGIIPNTMGELQR